MAFLICFICTAVGFFCGYMAFRTKRGDVVKLTGAQAATDLLDFLCDCKCHSTPDVVAEEWERFCSIGVCRSKNELRGMAMERDRW